VRKAEFIIPFVILVAWSTVAGAAGTNTKVYVMHSGQYYHRPVHLDGVEEQVLTPEQAVALGYTACPECTPVCVVNGTLRDPGPSAYYQEYLAKRTNGTLWDSNLLSAQAPRVATRAPAPEAAPEQAPLPPAPKVTPDPKVVPGTGGLLRQPDLYPTPSTYNPFAASNITR
jgi:hypothetical protein